MIDEMGYRPLDQVATSFLFQLVSRRHTRGSIIVTFEQVPRRVGLSLRR